MFRIIIVATGLALGLLFPALAGDPSADQFTEPEREWNLIGSPYVWADSLKGDASLAGVNSDVDIPFSEIFNHLDLAAMGNVEVTDELWGFYLDGQHVKTSQDEHLADHEID